LGCHHNIAPSSLETATLCKKTLKGRKASKLCLWNSTSVKPHVAFSFYYQDVVMPNLLIQKKQNLLNGTKTRQVYITQKNTHISYLEQLVNMAK
jgi:hypothetical protein